MRQPRQAASLQHAPSPARWPAAASASALCETRGRFSAGHVACLQAFGNGAWLAVDQAPSFACQAVCRCPQFTDTAMVRGMQQADAAAAAETMRDTGGRLLTVDQVGLAESVWLLRQGRIKSSSSVATDAGFSYLNLRLPIPMFSGHSLAGPPVRPHLRRWPRLGCTC